MLPKVMEGMNHGLFPSLSVFYEQIDRFQCNLFVNVRSQDLVITRYVYFEGRGGGEP